MPFRFHEASSQLFSSPILHSGGLPVPQGVLDVAGASPRRRFFQVLAAFCPDVAELEKDKLLYFASPEGRDDLYR